MRLSIVPRSLCAAALLAALVAGTGCIVPGKPSAAVAYGVPAATTLGGAALIVSAAKRCGKAGQPSCANWGPGMAFGVPMVAAGLIGLLLTPAVRDFELTPTTSPYPY